MRSHRREPAGNKPLEKTDIPDQARARSSQMPDVPTVAEMGLPGYQGVLWMGIVAPAATPTSST